GDSGKRLPAEDKGREIFSLPFVLAGRNSSVHFVHVRPLCPQAVPEIVPGTAEVVPNTQEVVPGTAEVVPTTPKVASKRAEVVPQTSEVVPGFLITRRKQTTAARPHHFQAYFLRLAFNDCLLA